MALESADQLNRILMQAVMAQFDQLQKDLEVRMASALKVADTGAGQRVIVNIAQTVAAEITSMLRATTIESGSVENAVRKLI